MSHMNAKFLSASLLALALPFAANAADPLPGRAPVPRSTQPGGTPALAPAQVVVPSNPGLSVAHTKITQVVVPAKVLPGTPLTVKVFGTGVETQCPTTVLIGKDGNTYYKKGAVQFGTGAWPRVSTFMLDPGVYSVRISMTEGGPGTTQAEREACGTTYANGNTGIAGDGTIVTVANPVAN